jgi:hypothetical protein
MRPQPRSEWSIFLRRLAIAAVVLAVGSLCCWGLAHRLGIHGFAEPPRVGERADAVIERLGTPHHDSRKGGDSPEDYHLGWTDGTGKRHHLHVEYGVVTEITYSSR